MPSILSLLQIAPPFVLERNVPTLEAWLFAFLCADSSVAAIAGTRIYEGIVPQGESYPAISYSVIGGNREAESLDGVDGQVSNRLQINCYATSGVKRRQLADAVRKVMNGLKEDDTKEIQDCWLENEFNREEPMPGNEAQRLYGRILDFEITHIEPI